MHNPNLTSRAKELRRDMTRQEKHLWYDFLQKHPLKFRRQRQMGYYITDFYCPVAKTAIEVDGAQHFEPRAMLKDRIRTEFIEKFDVEVIRVSNYDIDHNFDGACVYIDNLLHERTIRLYTGEEKSNFLVKMPDVVRQWVERPAMQG